MEGQTDLAKQILDQATDAMIFADRSGTIRRWNRASAVLFGLTAEEISSSIPARPSILCISPRGRAFASPIRTRSQRRRRSPRLKRIELGAGAFANNCQACHQANGEGVPEAFPQLAKSDYLNGDKIRGSRP